MRYVSFRKHIALTVQPPSDSGRAQECISAAYMLRRVSLLNGMLLASRSIGGVGH